MRGPVLCFRGLHERRYWRLAALVVRDSGGRAPPPMLLAEADPVQPQHLAERCGRSLWRYDFRLPLGEAEREAA